MKTITLKNTGVCPQTIYVGEDEASVPVQQVTIAHTSKDNPGHPRNIQVSNEFIFVKRYGSPAVAMHVDDFIQICTMAEPKISWPPLFIKNVVTNGSPAVVEALFEEHNPELSPEQNIIIYQWQQQANGNIWVSLEDGGEFSGCKTNKISVTSAPGDATKTLRCVATNAAGSRSSLLITSAPQPVSPPLAK